MSEISKMLEELCPDGVEYKRLGEVGTFYRGNGLQKKDFTDTGVGCIHYGQIYTYYGTYTFETKSKVPIELADKLLKVNPGDLVIACTSENVEDVCKSVAWLGEEVIVTGGHSAVYKHTLDPKYVAYFFQTQDFFQQKKKYARGTKVIDIKVDDLAKIEIPVPPLAVQKKIVEYLDNFTALIAELQARQQQYEYYRDNLLSFNRGGQSEAVEWKMFEEVFEMRNGYTPSKRNADYWTNGTIPWFRMEDIRENGRILSDSIQHISVSSIKGSGLFQANSFILATTATIGEHALLIADSLANQRFTNLLIRKSLQNRLDTMYVYYYLFIVDEWCKSNVNISGFASVNMEKLKKLLFPIPPISEQKRIVSILNRFETLTTSLSEGLPAEIEARQQQYEYYRDKLLTFPRKAVGTRSSAI